MLTLRILTGLGVFSPHPKTKNRPPPCTTRSSTLTVSCSLGSQSMAVEHLKYRAKNEFSSPNGGDFAAEEELKGPEEEKRISGIHVRRQKYISVSKRELLDAILSMFESKQDAEEFLFFSTCLDSILHAEHKGILEDMRKFYSFSWTRDQKDSNGCTSIRLDEAVSGGQHLDADGSNDFGSKGINCHDEDDEPLYFSNSFDLKTVFGSFRGTTSKDSVTESRVALATRFQHSFMNLLRDAEFEELSAQDLLLAYALNSDYLLTLPIYVDWKKASKSNAIIFRRGYATERQKGLLIVEKLDYLQSKLLQQIFFSLSKPLKRIGSWLNKALKSTGEARDMEIWFEKVKLWLKEQYLTDGASSGEKLSGKLPESDQTAGSDLPIWLAAQTAVSRYEGFLSSVGPRGRLMRKLLTWVGIIPSVPEASINIDDDSKHSETYLRPNFLQRITLTNIWEPATREYCGYNVWKMIKTAVSILFSKSTLQEPAFQELILLYTDEPDQNKTEEKSGVLPLQLKIYEKIPIPDLPVIFPHKKLSFRILDTVRLDVASILGLLAYFVNYKFENIISSPSAVLLDVIAISALVIYLSRVVLGYKQTWDRYQLLVNRTLYEKTLASGFGSVHFLLDASEQQQYKEAILVYALLLHPEKYQVSCHRSIGDACEKFIYDNFKEKIEMPVDKALNTLVRLDLVTELSLKGNPKLKALPCSKACDSLRKRWEALLVQKT